MHGEDHRALFHVSGTGPGGEAARTGVGGLKSIVKRPALGLKRIIAPLLTLLAFAMIALPCDATYVKGYYRKNGTYVAPHYRRSPTSSKPTTSHKGYSRTSGTYVTPQYQQETASSSPATSYSTSIPYENARPQQDIPVGPCAWVDENGVPCKRNANPGYRYCYRHVGLTPPSAKTNHAGKQEPVNETTHNLSLGEITVEHGTLVSVQQTGSKHALKKTRSVSLAVSTFFVLLFISVVGFSLFSQCSVPHKIVRAALAIPGILGASLLMYWYGPVRRSVAVTNVPTEEEPNAAWHWSARPESRLLFVTSNEKIKGDHVQLVLNGKGKPYVGIAFPVWLNVQTRATIPVAVRFDNNEPLQDPWIRSKNGGGMFAPWSMKDFIEAAEASHSFGITFEDKNKMSYTFTFNIGKLKITLGPDRKYFMEDK